ncbi:acetoin utilization protein AcuC [Bacillus sp. 03113]|uniref:acetoin utilization protein AcuC n=1 Tax=Bacillus sp. 03113 TaxID=2578211 RepID=UPI001141AAE6|nr:acetoin utilization protein AcuC [Bacillus sp. 03113]
MKNDSIFIYSEELLSYKFHPHHPFNQLRIKITYDLLMKMNVLQNHQIIAPRKASDTELQLFLDPGYIHAVKLASHGELSKEQCENYGLGTEDTPIFSYMHEASSLLVGGTLTAVDYVMSGQALHSLHLGGGLHHGFNGKAAGFCIYNDSAIALKYLLEKYRVRVLYVDTDAHHGDGVQWAFYDDPNVCTLSIHETGRYLFPGTGNVNERGEGAGYGYTFNIPLDAYTEDESFLYTYQTALEEIAAFFKPDVIFSVNGVDAHFLDPLTHLSTTVRLFREIPKIAHQIAHQYCNGRWIAVGGGGYDIWRVVPRAWSYIWMEMIELDPIPKTLPKEWIHNWRNHTTVPLPQEWDDQKHLIPLIPRKEEITQKNMMTLNQTLYSIRNNS